MAKKCAYTGCYMVDSNGRPASPKDSVIMAKAKQKAAKDSTFIAKRTAQNAKYNAKISSVFKKK